MIRTTFPVGPFQCNCSILVDEATRDAVIVDPGWEEDAILAEVDRLGARVRVLAHTHAHIDHINATHAVHAATGARIALHVGDLPLCDGLPGQAAMFGLPVSPPVRPDTLLGDGDVVEAGSIALRVLHTPGHTPGSICFHFEGEEPVIFTGDTLFRLGIGRTDLWGGSHPAILRSIRERLFTLDGELRVVPGHGEETTIGFERARNPFFR